jgi:SAM-dependent methyltransferase
MPDGSINVDLLDMPFAEASLDIVMTSDVMEHVSNDEQAHREIYRCLGPGGCYIFTVPYDPCLLAHRRLTQPTTATTPNFVLDSQVHGDPHSSSGIEAHRIYGQQLFADLQRIGFRVEFLDIVDAQRGIFGGDLFMATKES